MTGIEGTVEMQERGGCRREGDAGMDGDLEERLEVLKKLDGQQLLKGNYQRSDLGWYTLPRAVEHSLVASTSRHLLSAIQKRSQPYIPRTSQWQKTLRLQLP